VIGETKTSKE